MKNKSIMCFIIAYNAEKTIIKLLERFPKKVVNSLEEIVLADDASTDKTSELASDYKKRNNLDKLTLIKHKTNKCYGGNQKWNFNYAIENEKDVVCMIHGDIQYPPEYIMPLIHPICEGKADFVFGSRMAGHPLKGGMPLYKFFGNIFLTTIENIVLGTKLSDFHTGFRAYSVDALKEIPFNLNSDGFHFDSEIIIQGVIAKKRIEEITIPTYYGDEISRVNVIKYGFNILKELSKYLLNKYKIKQYEKYNFTKS